jgi:ABC-type dipeptide/oligopeptide/nickel transport system permease subunit
MVCSVMTEFLRLLYGARISAQVAVLATIAVMILGILLGTMAGYYRGLVDTAIPASSS